jgi:hypothetical protein
MNKNKIIFSVAILLIIAGGCFYSGILYGKNTNKQNNGFNREQQFNIPQNTNAGIRNNNANTGEIILKDQESITIKLMNGGSKIIFISDSTQVSKNIDTDIEELEVGQNIIVQGTDNSDNSVTAKSIQIMQGSQNRMNMIR